MLVLSARGQARTLFTAESDWPAVCKAAVAEPLPTRAAALAAAAHADRGPRHLCDETRAYYGFGQAPDDAKALRCAYLQRDRPLNDAGSFAWRPGTLSMLYANGYGIPRDYTLAIRFACELNSGAAGAETETRLGRLEALRDGKLPENKPFDLCDNATSGAMGSYCEYVEQKQADVSRRRSLAQLKAQLPEAAQAMFPALLAAEAGFEKSRGSGEYTGGGGSGSSGFKQADQGHLREQFAINLQRFASGDLPKTMAADRARAERALMAASAKAEDFTPGPDAYSMDPTPQSLSATQRAWQALFKEWMRFVPVAYPHLSPDRAATELLRLRIHQLKKVAPSNL